MEVLKQGYQKLRPPHISNELKTITLLPREILQSMIKHTLSPFEKLISKNLSPTGKFMKW